MSGGKYVELLRGSSVMATKRIAFALTRRQWRDGVEQYISGALGEYVMAEVAELNGYTLYLPHWHSEVDRLLDLQLHHFIRNKQTKTQFDKAVVVEDVIAEYDPQILRWMESAKTSLANNYFKKTKRPTDFKLPDPELCGAAFWVRVKAVMTDALDL
jgi:hypothetical protein